MPLPWTRTTSELWPNTSAMSVRRRRAAAPVSSSASTTIRPLTMWRPPANRSIEATSALRQQVFETWVLDSSAFTCAVIAMGPILPRQSTTLGGSPTHDHGVRRRQSRRVVSRSAVVARDVREMQLRAVRRDRGVELLEGVTDGLAVGQHGVDPHVRRVVEQRGQVVDRPVAVGLATLLTGQVEVDHDPRVGLDQRAT